MVETNANPVFFLAPMMACSWKLKLGNMLNQDSEFL